MVLRSSKTHRRQRACFTSQSVPREICSARTTLPVGLLPYHITGTEPLLSDNNGGPDPKRSGHKPKHVQMLNQVPWLPPRKQSIPTYRFETSRVK